MKLSNHFSAWDLIPGAILLCDAQGIIVYWNQGCSQIFEYSADQVLGQSLDLIIPEKHRAAHWAGWNKALERGSSVYSSQALNAPALHQNGTRISIAFSLRILSNPNEESMVLALIQDQTEIFQELKSLRQNQQK